MKTSARVVRWTALAAVLLLLLVQGGLGAAESVGITPLPSQVRSRSDVPVNGTFTTAGAATTLRYFVDGALDGTTAATGTWSYVLGATSSGLTGPYADGQHTLLVQSEDGAGALFAVAAATFTVNLSPDLFLGGLGVRDTGPVTFATGENVLASGAAIATYPSTAVPATKVKTLAITLDDRPDGSAETLKLKTGFVLSTALTANFDNLSGTLIVTISGATPVAPSILADVARNVVYLTTQTSPTAGLRRVRWTLTDKNNALSPVATATIDVTNGSGGPPVVSLGGDFASANVTATLLEGGAALAIAPGARILANPTAPWPTPVFDPVTSRYTPSFIYTMTANDSLSQYSGAVLDTITITLTNPGGGGLLPAGTEALSITPTSEFTYGSTFVTRPANAAPGHFLYFDGNEAPLDTPAAGDGGAYMMYTVGGSYSQGASSGSLVVSASQNAAQLACPIRSASGTAFAPDVRPIPTAFAETLLRSIAYTNTSTNPTRLGNQRVVTVTVSNSCTAATIRSSVTRTCTITLVPSNEAPVIAGPSSFSGNEETPLALDGLQVSDNDGNGGNETLTLEVAHGTLSLSDLTGLAVVGNGTAKVTLTGALDDHASGVLALALARALRPGNLTFAPTAQFSGTDQLRVILTDNGHSSDATATPQTTTFLPNSGGGPITLVIAAVNDPPDAALPGPQITQEDQDRIIGGLAVNDPDQPTGQVQVALAAVHGVLTLNDITGLGFAFSDADGSGSGSGTADRSMVFRGTLSDINTALIAVNYHPDLHFYGSDTLTIAVNDLGNTGLRSGAAGGTIAFGGSANSWVRTRAVAMSVRFTDQRPAVVVSPASCLVSGTITLVGGTYLAPTYPLLGQPLNPDATAAAPAGAGTSANVGAPASNLVASDPETRDARGLSYTVALATTQGDLLRRRPGDPAGGVLLAAGTVFTQDDLNNGYITYVHNGTLSGDDGFVFTVADDNDASHPVGVSDVARQQSPPTVFQIAIDRSRPVVVLAGVGATFTESIAGTPGSGPVALDNDPATVVVNATSPGAFVPPSGAGTVTVSLAIPTPVATALTPSGDAQDVLALKDQAPITVSGQTVLFNGSQAIGSLSGGTGGAPLVVSLSSSAPIPVSAVSALIRNLTFTNASSNPSAATRVATIIVQNGSGLSSLPVTTAITVVPVNNPPVIAAPAVVATVPGLTVTGQTGASDPDSPITYAVTGSPPTKGQVSVASDGTFTYVAAAVVAGAGGLLSDHFDITVTDDFGAITTATFTVRISDLGATAPVVTSNPPMEATTDGALVYQPAVSTAGLVAPVLRYVLIGPTPVPTLAPSFSTSDGTLNWPAVPQPTGGYYDLGILVIDQISGSATYQPILLKVVTPPLGGG
ncbi:MAG: hypothetical protein H0X38_11240 [Planctomycetes bacterium]|nr:hypothetical protein [Planctomycetota bacterium]